MAAFAGGLDSLSVVVLREGLSWAGLDAAMADPAKSPIRSPPGRALFRHFNKLAIDDVSRSFIA